MIVPQTEHWIVRHAGTAISAQASLIEKPACVWTFWLIALVPLVWPQSLDVVQFISSGVLQLVALPVLAVAGATQAQRSRKQARADHEAMMTMMRELRQMHAELHAKLN